MKKQQGFTLIELMIVVAVIGVLSAIAIPQYQKYVAKAEGASALATLTALKTNTEAFTVENGNFPAQTNSADVGTPSSALGSITYVNSTKGAGTITLAFGMESTKVSPLNKGGSLVLERSEEGTWTCTANAADKAIISKGCTFKLTANQ